MTSSPAAPEPLLRQAGGPRTGCANCARAEEADLPTVVANLSRKYTQLADVMTRYMSEAGIDRATTRSRNTAAPITPTFCGRAVRPAYESAIEVK